MTEANGKLAADLSVHSPLAAITPDQVRECLRQVEDPELGINIVDLGLVYEVWTVGNEITIHMTMTSAACPLHAEMTREAEELLWRRWPQAGEIRIELVWNPRWTPEMMSPAARRSLGWKA